jgi:hypothetical protein
MNLLLLYYPYGTGLSRLGDLAVKGKFVIHPIRTPTAGKPFNSKTV